VPETLQIKYAMVNGPIVTSRPLSIVEKRSPLLVSSRGSLEPPGPRRNGDSDCRDEEEGHDDKGEDPLERDDLAQELGDSDRGSKNTEGESHRVVLSQSVLDVATWSRASLVLTL
jgi:hypothetical protein